MYLERLQLGNYGPIRDLDITFPFDGARPKPVLLVGEIRIFPDNTRKGAGFGPLLALLPVESGRGASLAQPSESPCQTTVYGGNSPQRRDSTPANRPFTTSRHPRLAVRRCI